MGVYDTWATLDGNLITRITQKLDAADRAYIGMDYEQALNNLEWARELLDVGISQAADQLDRMSE